ncbi:MAG: hypothetical protein ACRBHB_25160 [Arenicella sp.]
MKYPHYKVLKSTIEDAFSSNKHILALELDNFSEELDFEITGVAQSLFESDVPNIKLKKQLSLWFAASFPEQDWNENMFTDTVIKIKTNLKKIENV